MRRTMAALGLLVTVSGGLVWTQSVDEFDAWMTTIDERTNGVQAQIGLKDAAAAAAEAKVLVDTFKKVEAFWVRRGDAPDAVALSKEALERAVGVVKAAEAKDYDAASSQAIKLAETCTPCHRVYRPFP